MAAPKKNETRKQKRDPNQPVPKRPKKKTLVLKVLLLGALLLVGVWGGLYSVQLASGTLISLPVLVEEPVDAAGVAVDAAGRPVTVGDTPDAAAGFDAWLRKYDEFGAALVRLVSENPGELDVLDEGVDRDILTRLQIDPDLQHDRRVVSQFLFAHRNPPVN